MKTNFALGLTDDGITLWQRGSPGWLRVGAVPPDAEDLDTQMQGLVKIASALAPEGLLTKLVVPDAQILYCTLPVSARNREMQGHEIRAQLAGRTPYPVEELDFDWNVSDGMAEVAVVARETLVEAEDFARGYGLNPACSVAAPANGNFEREPFFGTARGLRNILDDPSQLERDDDILHETGAAVLPDPELMDAPAPTKPPENAGAAAATKPQPEAEIPPEAAATTTDKEPGAAETTPDTAAKPTRAAASPPKRKRKPNGNSDARKSSPGSDPAPTKADSAPSVPESAPAPSAAQVDKPTPASTAPDASTGPDTSTGPDATAKPDAPAAAPQSALLAKLKAAKSVSLTPETDATPAPNPAPAPAPAPAEQRKSALERARQKFSSAVGARADAGDAVSGTDDDTAAADGSGSVAFRSRRAAPGRSETSGAPASETSGMPTPEPETGNAAPRGGLRAKLPDVQTLSRRGLGGLGKVIGKAKAPTGTAETQGTADTPAAGAKGKAAASAGKTQKKTAASRKSAYPISIAPAQAGDTRSNPLDTLKARSGGKAVADEAERMTIFGARNHTDLGGSTPRRALLVLSGVGLILLAAAIWVAFFTSTGPDAPQLAEDSAGIETPAPLVTDPTETLPTETAGTEDSAVAEDFAAAEEIEAALGLEDAAQQQPIDAPEPETTAQADPSQSEPERPTADAPPAPGRIAGLRSSALLPPQDAAPLPDAPAAPAPFGSDPLPPSRSELAAAEALRAQEAQDALDAQDTPGDLASAEDPASVLPEGEEALEIEIAEGTPPAIPPARPEGLAPEPEIPAEPAPEAEPASEAGIQPEPEPEAQPDVETALAAALDPETGAETGLETTEAAPDLSPDAVPGDAIAGDAIPADEAGLVIDVTQGRPASVPPGRPEGLAPEPPPSEDLGDEAGGTPAADPDSALDTSADQARLDTPPPGGVALTALRPQTRPAALVAQATEAATEAEPQMSDSQHAVASSLRPGARPGQFSAVVQRALRAAQTRSAAQPPADAPVQTASAAAAAPQIPTSASVAQEATQRRAINLRQVNLIGVMGTSSNRRALVRLSNGRVVTVRVGDALDNGRVTAIGENELRYNRRGRDQVLRIAS